MLFLLFSVTVCLPVGSIFGIIYNNYRFFEVLLFIFQPQKSFFEICRFICSFSLAITDLMSYNVHYLNTVFTAGGYFD